MRGPKRATATTPDLPAEISAADAFKAIGETLVRKIAAQQPRVRKRSPDGVHRMRIELRRLRSAISIFDDLLKDEPVAHLRKELKWLSSRLAPARDFHVMQSTLRRRRVAHGSLLDRATTSRAAAFDQAKAAVEQRRFQLLLRELQQWVEAGPSAADKAEGVTARHFAERVLTRRAERVTKKAAKLHSLDVEQRHRLRIAAKKLYYAADLLDSLFVARKSAKRLAAFKKRLKKLLDALGELNDIAVRDRLLKKLLRSPRPTTSETAAARALREQDRADTAELLKAATKAGRKLADQRLFGD